jgi:hypothetical protein
VSGSGWIKLHRKMLENPIIQRPNYLALWVVLLLKANHKEHKMIWNNNIMVVKEGQLITGRSVLAKETGLSQTTVERILDFLEKDHQIGQQKTTKFRLITIVNWKSYQNVDNKRTTNGQQTDTNKNDKKEKNEKKEIVASDIPFSLKEEIGKLEENTRRDMNIIALYFEHRKPDIQNREQFEVALRRHLKPAGILKSFTDTQILKALDYAKREYKDIYTLETLFKILCK